MRSKLDTYIYIFIITTFFLVKFLYAWGIVMTYLLSKFVEVSPWQA